MSDITNIAVSAGNVVPVDTLGGQVTVKVNSGGPVYYADNAQVSSANNQGNITAGNSVTFSSPQFITGAAGVQASVTLTLFAGSSTAPGGPKDVVLGSDGLVGGPGGTGLTTSVANASSAATYLPAPSGSAATDTANMNAAIAIGGRIVPQSNATYLFNAELDLGATTTIDGDGSTIFRWATDLGAGKYAIKTPSPTAPNDYQGSVIRGVRLHGPGYGSFVMGVAPASMDGIYEQQRVKLQDVNISGFRSAIVRDGDHTQHLNVKAGGNYYALYLAGAGVNGKGNSSDVGCDYGGNTFASLAIAHGYYLDSDYFAECHFGYSPYCIYKESGTADTFATNLSAFETCSFENFGNGVIYDESLNSTMNDVEFLQCAQYNQDDTYKIAARDKNWTWRIGIVQAVKIKQTDSNAAMLTPLLAGCIQTTSIHNTEWEGAARAIALCHASGLKIIDGTQSPSIDLSNILWNQPGNKCILAAHITSAPTQYNLCNAWASPDVQLVDTTKPVFGVTQMTGAANDFVPVLVEGRTFINAKGGETFGQSLYQPDGTGKITNTVAGKHGIAVCVGSNATGAGGGGILLARLLPHQPPGTTYEITANKGAASGYAALDGSSRVVQAPKLHASDHQTGGADALALSQYDRDLGYAGVIAPTGVGVAVKTDTLLATFTYFVRVRPSRPMTIISIAFVVVTAAGSAGDTVDLGIYSADFTTLLGSAGSTAPGTNSTGVKNVSLSASVALSADTTYYAAIGTPAAWGGSAPSLSFWSPGYNVGMAFGTATGQRMLALRSGAAVPLVADPHAGITDQNSAPFLFLRES